MKNLSVLLFLWFSIQLVHLQGPGSGTNGNLRLCVVEGRGPLKRGATFCPLLDDEPSGLECVLGTDQLDCLRRISKGTVDFGVFSPEDLIAAQWANIDVLVTNEMRNRFRPYERSIVAVVNRRILPDHPSSLEFVLRNTTLCHPGVGVNDLRPLSDTLAGVVNYAPGETYYDKIKPARIYLSSSTEGSPLLDVVLFMGPPHYTILCHLDAAAPCDPFVVYLESLIIPRACDPNLTLTENRIKAIAEFFNKACKAGPWVPDAERDAELKRKYSRLCEACASPACGMDDKYWGSTGTLQCLVDNSGDAMWGELDDVLFYFGVNTTTVAAASGKSFAYLCRDGTWQDVEGNLAPCVWLNRPWPVVVAKRKAAAAVSKLIGSITDNDLFNNHWRGALAALLELRQTPTPLNPPKTPLDYLASAKGFREAYSQSGCDPPRHITLCATSTLERNKCEWLSEAGAVYGINPPLQCVLRQNTRECLQAVQRGECDTTVADSEWLMQSYRDFGLEPLLYEVTPIVEKMETVVAYVRKDAAITNMEELNGKRAAFPRYDGMAWHSVLNYLKIKQTLSCTDTMTNYFSSICAPGVEKLNISKEYVNRFTSNCIKNGDDIESGDLAALQSLVMGKSDVAFISMKTGNSYQNKKIMEPWANGDVDILPVCPEENKKYCYLSWSNIGHIYAAKNITMMKRHEIINVFTKLDQLFGKHQPFHSVMFTMYGPFNHVLDVLFHNNTKSLTTAKILKIHPYANMPLNFERSIINVTSESCQISDLARDSALNFAPTFSLLMLSIVFNILNR